MSIVKINVLQVPEGRGEVLEQRFAARAGEVEKVEGFESFELLRPTEGTDRYLVVTRWRDEDAFKSWLTSDAFGRGHAQSQADRDAEEAGGGHPGGEGAQGGGLPGGGPAAVGSELWGFEIVTSAIRTSG
jgi:heme oxygenase (mycobilin-producing)